MKEAKAAITDGNGQFTFETIEVDAPGPGEVLVELKASGLCHTDYDSLNWGEQLVMGHEGAGIVIAIGEGVKRVSPGDHVLLNWAMSCGTCNQCARGNQHICENNSPVTARKEWGGHADPRRTTFNDHPIKRSFNLGTFSTHTVVIEAATVPLPKQIPFTSACIVGCGVMTGFGSVVNAAKVQAGSSVVVLGTGGVGLNVIQGARIAGARQIIAVDISEKRLEFAKRFGATVCYQADKEDTGLRRAAAELNEQFGGADYAFECTANPSLGDAPLAFIRNAGTAIQASGIEQKITFDAELFEWDKIYMNPLYGKCKPMIDFPILFDFYQSGELLLDQLVTQRYALEELQLAIDDMLAGRNAKGVIDFDETS